MISWRIGSVLMLSLSLCMVQAVSGEPQGLQNGRSILRVCLDPNNMPFSSSQGEGIENRVAQLLGQAWGVPVSYYAFPQRMGFIRNTLRYRLPGEDYPCDIVMGVPAGFDQVATTSPYYRSSYALVFPLGKGLDSVFSVQDFLALEAGQLRQLRIGIYDRSPASAWLSQHGLQDLGVPYKMLNADPAQYPGDIIEYDLAQGRINMAVVWGPLASYFAKRVKSSTLRVVPMRSEPGVTLEFDIAMGVRHGEAAWRAQVESALKSHRSQIQAILQAFDVPMLEVPHAAVARP